VNGLTLRLGSRRSPMAIAQSRLVARRITEQTGREVEVVGVTTLGDVSRAQLTQIGGTGVFASALREALLAGQIDLAVLAALAAGCSAPVAAFAVSENDGLHMRAAVMSLDGSAVLRTHGRGAPADARRLGRDLAAELLRAGAADLIKVPQAPASSGNDVQ
jgi:porphobilinogen deaminase